MSWRLDVTNGGTQWAYLSQTSDYTTDGQANEDAYLACGAACIVETIYHELGKRYSTDQIKDRILGQGAQGIIYSWQILDFLNGKYSDIFNGNLGARVIVPQYTTPINATGSLLYYCWNYLFTGHAPIILRWWDHLNNYDVTGKPIYHWLCVTGMDANYVYMADTLQESTDIPIGNGWTRKEDYTAFQNMSQQLMIVVGAPRFALSQPPVTTNSGLSLPDFSSKDKEYFNQAGKGSHKNKISRTLDCIKGA